MKLLEALTRLSRFSPPSVPELRYIEAAVQRVHERWPDVIVPVDSRERETLALRLKGRIEQDDWTDTRISFVLAAAHAVLDEERRDRSDLAEPRKFLYAETRASRSETFLSGMLAVHLDSFEPGAAHSRALAAAFDAARERMSPSGQRLLSEVSELLDAADGPRRLAARMARMTDPFLDLSRLGLRNPHGAGFMDHAHAVLSTLVRDELKTRDRIDWFLAWLRPPGREARTSGAEQAIEALTHPWLKEAPGDAIRSHLTESLIEMYGDPRIRSGGVWAGVAANHMQVIHRWLTREDMRFFTGVVDAAQKNPMWLRRRDVWLRLFDERWIDAAWVAFSSQATKYARDHLMRHDARNKEHRLGYQAGRPSTNTSLLIMKIGDKIVVDGCHDYSTHIFNQTDPMAPRLFQEGYDCDEIKERAPASKPHNSIRVWERWVRDTVNSDVPFSSVSRPYRKVFRPRPSGSSFGNSSAEWSQEQRSLKPGYEAPVVRQPERQAPRQTRADRRPTASRPISPVPVPERRPAIQGEDFAPPQERTKQRATNPSPRKKQFGSRTDWLIACGPKAASAVMADLKLPEDGKQRPHLSSKAREGLEWVQAQRGEPPRSLRNALEHLLNSLENMGTDLDALFESNSTPARITPVSGGKPSGPMANRRPRLPPLPDTRKERIDLLFTYTDRLAMFIPSQKTLSNERALMAAVNKLKIRSPELRPGEINLLLQLYELMRRNEGERG